MARGKSDDRRDAIADAATRIIAARGLLAPTALIAKEAGISTGSLFTYFATKADLLNELFVDLKAEMAAAALDGLPADQDVRSRLAHVWSGWIEWAVGHPHKRRALAQLAVSDQISASSREAGHRAMSEIAALLEQSRRTGPMRAAPIGLVAGLLNGAAEATVDHILVDPAHAARHREIGFAAAWRMIA